jgi:hypothetical protein
MPGPGRSRFPVLCAASLAVALAAPPRAARAQQAADVPRGQRLLSEGDALADEGKYDDAVMRYMDAFEALLPSMRKLPFKRDVKGHFTPRKELRGIMEKLIAEEVKPDEFRADELAMKALGLVPADFDLKQAMIGLMTDEVAGFYDPKAETMHLIHEELAPPKPKGAKGPGLLGRLFGGADKPAFDKDQNRMVLAHELTHALADQHFDLDRLREATEGDGDRELALMALVEGEAVLTMMGAAAGDWDGTATAQLPARQLSFMMNMMGPMMTSGSSKALREAPPVISETLIFPYAQGVVFAAHLTNDGGWAALDAAYAKPPLSTEQVMHPEKYADGTKVDPPTALDPGELKPGGGWKELDRDVVGELVTAIMLRGHGGRAAAAGWDGDTAAVFEGADGKLGLVWVSTWDTEQDAREFARGYAGFQARKFQLPGAPAAEEEGAAGEPGGQDGAPALGLDLPDPDADAPPADAPAAAAAGDDEAPPAAPGGFPAAGGDDALRRDHDGATLHVEVRGTDVAIVEGFPPDATDALLKAAFAAGKTEKTRDADPPKAD